MTEEEKAAAKAKRDAEKSGGGGGGGGPTSTAGVLNPKLAAVVASIEQQVAAAAGGGGTAVKSLKPKIGPPPVPVPKKMDLSFFPIKHEGSSYYTNDRGDLVSEDWEWVGHFDGKAIDESAPEPDDLGEATLRA
jgi:hypothetical protein